LDKSLNLFPLTLRYYYYYYLTLSWRRKGNCDNPSKKELLNEVTFVYKSCLSV